MSQCENCPLGNATMGAPVPGKLAGGCDLMIVGEGPGVEEVRKGEPFVGPSGQLLKRVLNLTGGADLRISLTNATMCRPGGGLPVSKEMIRCCRQRLLHELETEQPKVVLALGNSAMLGITDEATKITQIHGIARQHNGFTLLPCIHPAAVLRDTNSYGRMKDAIGYAVRLGKGEPPKNPGTPEYLLVEDEATLEQAIDILDTIKQSSDPEDYFWGCDIETTGLDPRTDTITSFGIAYARNKVLIFPGRMIFDERVRGLFELGFPNRYIWHNGKFDVKFLRHLGIRARVDEDVMLMHYALSELQGHDLETLSGEYLGAPEYKKELDKWKKVGWEGCPPETQYEYLAKDCDYTWQLWREFRPKLEAVPDSTGGPGLTSLYRNVLLPASDFLIDVETRGIRISLPLLRETREDLQKQMEGVERDFHQAVVDSWPDCKISLREEGLEPPRLNLNSWKQLQVWFYDQDYLALPVPPHYDMSTQESVLKLLPSHPTIDLLLKYRGLKKLLSTYVDGIEKYVGDDSRVRAGYLLHGTRTGRLSSSKPNLQNVPKNDLIRRFFLPEYGFRFLEIDLAQAELRVAAAMSGDEGMIEIFREGRSLHKEVALELFGEGYDNKQYTRAKTLNFAILYGRTADGLLKDFNGPDIPTSEEVTRPQAQAMIHAWFARFPKVQEYLLKLRGAPLSGKAIMTSTGRRRRFGSLITRDNREAIQNEAGNFGIQSIASDINLISAIRAQPWLHDELGADILNLVHDSVMIEVPDDEERVRAAFQKMSETFREVGGELIGDSVPILCEAKVGYTWADMEDYEPCMNGK